MNTGSRKNVNELRAGAILSYVNLAISCIIPLLYTPIMLRMLGKSEYGLYTISNSVISYLSILNFGMGSAIVRYVTKARVEGDKEEINRTVGQFLSIYFIFAGLVLVVGCGLLFFAGGFFAKGLNQDEISRLRVLILIMTVSTAISFPASVFSSVIIAYEKYIFNRIYSMIGTILAPILNLIVLYMGMKSLGMACMGLLIQILNIPVYIFYCRIKLNVIPKFGPFPKDKLREIVVFSAFIFLSSLVDMLYWSTDKVLIGAMISSAAVAVYNVGGEFTAILQNMAHAISGVFTPKVTAMVVKKRSIEENSDLLIRIGRLQYLIVSLILSGYIVFGQHFIHFWAGDEYLEAYKIALLTMIPISVPLIQSIAFTTIVAQNKHKFRSILYAVIAVINVISTWLVIPKYGIVGAAVCTCVAYVLGQGIIMNIYYWKVTGLDIPLFWKNIGRMSAVPISMVIIGYYIINNVIGLTDAKMFFIEVVVYTMIFSVGSWIFNMNEYEKNIVRSIFKKIRAR